MQRPRLCVLAAALASSTANLFLNGARIADLSAPLALSAGANTITGSGTGTLGTITAATNPVSFTPLTAAKVYKSGMSVGAKFTLTQPLTITALAVNLGRVPTATRTARISSTDGATTYAQVALTTALPVTAIVNGYATVALAAPVTLAAGTYVGWIDDTSDGYNRTDTWQGAGAVTFTLPLPTGMTFENGYYGNSGAIPTSSEGNLRYVPVVPCYDSGQSLTINLDKATDTITANNIAITGGVTIQNGTLKLGNKSALGGNTVNVAASGTLDLTALKGNMPELITIGTLAGKISGADNVLDSLGATTYLSATSLRRLKSTFAGAAIRVRRSTDNTEQDISFDITKLIKGNFWIDEAALLAFVGVGNGFVRTVYDQSGAGNHLQMPTSARQPRIVSAGAVERIGNRPAINYLGSHYFDLTTRLTNVRSTYTVLAWGALDGNPRFIFGDSSNYHYHGDAANKLLVTYAVGSVINGQGAGKVNGVVSAPLAITKTVGERQVISLRGGSANNSISNLSFDRGLSGRYYRGLRIEDIITSDFAPDDSDYHAAAMDAI